MNPQALGPAVRIPPWVRRLGSRSKIMGDGLFRNNVRKSDFDAIVKALKADGLIEERTTRDTGGAPRTEYRLAPIP